MCIRDRYAHVLAEKATKNRDGSRRFRVADMCRWLGVSESGFFDWVKRPASATAQRRRKLGRLIREIFIHHPVSYTHLDVYKRQYVMSPTIFAPGTDAVKSRPTRSGIVTC